MSDVIRTMADEVAELRRIVTFLATAIAHLRNLDGEHIDFDALLAVSDGKDLPPGAEDDNG